MMGQLTAQRALLLPRAVVDQRVKLHVQRHVRQQAADHGQPLRLGQPSVLAGGADEAPGQQLGPGPVHARGQRRGPGWTLQPVAQHHLHDVAVKWQVGQHGAQSGPRRLIADALAQAPGRGLVTAQQLDVGQVQRGGGHGTGQG